MELAAGLAVEQIITTTIEAAVVGGFALSRPTNQLKATFKRIGTVPKDDTPDSLARSHHSVNVIDGDLFIFGGRVSPNQLAGNDMHILKLSNVGGLGPQYKAVPALARDGDDVPQARAGHTACNVDGKIVMFGGHTDSNPTKPLDEGGRVWVFDPSSLHWSHLDTANERYPRIHSHAAVPHNNSIIVHGGYSFDSALPCSDTWRFDLESRVWIEMPSIKDLHGLSPMAPAAPPNFTIVNDKIYSINGNSSLESQIYALDIRKGESPSAWTTMMFPTNPLVPGPRPRQGAATVPITTAIGRTYLLLALGAKASASAPEKHDDDTEQSVEETAEQFWSELWTLQLPATDYTPSQLKDAAREKIGFSSGQTEWAEVEIVLPEELPTEDGSAGKLHPGPRGYFGSAAIDKGKVAVWGGINPKGEIEGDGWIIEVKP